MTKYGFTNVHGHTAGSVLDAIIRLPELFDRAKELDYPAVAITDHGNMSQIYPAYKESKRTGVKLIPGNEIYFVEDLANPKSKRRHLVLLASSHKGYQNLCRITYEGFKNSVTIMNREFPRVDAAILTKYKEGLFATSACGGSIIAAHIFAGDFEGAKKQAMLFANIFGDRFFLEIQPHNLTRDKFSQRELNDGLIKVAEELGIEMVATCDSHYLRPEHEKFHDMVLAISDKKALSDLTRHRYCTKIPCADCSGSGELDGYVGRACGTCGGTGIGALIPCAEFYMKSEDEIRKFFADNYSDEFAIRLIKNTAKIGLACEPPTYLEPAGERLPKFDITKIATKTDAKEFFAWRDDKAPRKVMTDDGAYLRFRVVKEFKRYTESFATEKKKVYWDRVIAELDILESRGFCSYMLIVTDFIDWSRENDIWVGVGRGSAGSSLIGFFLGIHKIDPIKYGLIFERFQSKERKQLPDIDNDFPSNDRDKVFEYLKQRWGEEHVCFITNVNRLSPKVAIKDIARSLEVGGSKSKSFEIANAMTKAIPNVVTLKNGKKVEINTMELATQYTPELATFFQEYPEIEEHAQRIVGLPRAWGLHAGGFVVSDVVLPDNFPLRRDKDGCVSVHYDKNIAEEVGLVKIDILSLDTLDKLRETKESAEKLGIVLPHPWDAPLDDQKVYRMISDGKVMGLFQLEGTTLAKLCKPMQPKSIEDISLINALGRPGVDEKKRELFIERRHNRQPVSYVHPILESIAKPTLGISTYDEDLLKIAQKVAGWDLSKADGLRKLTKMKEKGAVLAIQLEKDFVNDAEKIGAITREDAQKIWDEVINDYAKYGFCKAHSIGYSMTGYATAYYKYYARASFMCAHLNGVTKKSDVQAIDDVKKEIRIDGITIKGCDINSSGSRYIAIDKKTIVTGLNALDGLGEKAIETIFAGQPFDCFPDFIYRTTSAVNKNVVISLAKGGAFDRFALSRKYVVDIFADATKGKKLRDKINKIGNAAAQSGIAPDWSTLVWPDQELQGQEWDLRHKLFAEREVLGEFISGTIEDAYPGFYRGGPFCVTGEDLERMPDKCQFMLEGLIMTAEEILTRSGKSVGQMNCMLSIENVKRETFKVRIWADQWAKIKSKMIPGSPIRAKFRVNDYGGQKNIAFVSLDGGDIWPGGVKK